MNTRIFIERQKDYQIERDALIHEIKHVLNIAIDTMRYFVIYDIQNMKDSERDLTLYTVFAEKNKDDVYFEIDLSMPHIAYEYLPGQYDQRADSALQCVHLLVDNPSIMIKSGTLLIFDENLESDDLIRIQNHLMNKVESRPKNLSVFEWIEATPPKDVKIIDGFIDLSSTDLENLYLSLELAMSMDDFLFVQAYFQSEKRNPTETEMKVLDTYWSDHCRHTTFETVLEDIHIEEHQEKPILEDTLKDYLNTRNFLNRNHLPVTLMDLATINARYEMKKGRLNDVEQSDEHNAASIIIDVDVDGQSEPWLLMFKNETHNHPTEIEPFGGASTCIGGAIRDPLSGRSYVYSATRITGAADITESLEQTRKGKLPQRVISKKAAEGYASYGNQIGLATTSVQEIYHEGYKAKRMEVGAVIGACPLAHVRRDTPKPGDLILLIGGRTGRDGIGGATGSSRSHKESSRNTSAAEVQKGNAVTERKIQRLFRHEAFSQCIKKSNDFGAGGVCVAIGELAPGVMIELDKVPTKYQGLNATELTISESQERMAVVIDPRHENQVKNLCYQENIEVTTIAKVIEENQLIMTFNNQTVCELKRSFIDTSGVRANQRVELSSDQWEGIFNQNFAGNNLKEQIESMLKDLNVASQQGLVEMFDSTIGTTTVVMPYGGKTQKTKAQAAIQRLPVLNGKTHTVSIMTHGFDPYISEKNPYLGASYAMIDSMAKTVASGGNHRAIRFTFQEYFEKLGKSPNTWGKPLKALLGAYQTLKSFGLAAIGGKDSMSGTFEDLHVPPTLISFAVSKGHLDHIISNTFVQDHSFLYLAKHQIHENGLPNSKQLNELYTCIERLILNQTIRSAYAIPFGGLMEALIKGTFGNRIGIKVDTKLDLFAKDYGSILIESKERLQIDDVIYLGQTTKTPLIKINSISLDIDEMIRINESKLNDVFPILHQDDRSLKALEPGPIYPPYEKVESTYQPRVIVPVFPGTNCEYDSIRAFRDAGAVVESFVFNNLTQQDIQTSIRLFAHHLDQTDILMLSGGFSSGDEPDGSGKFIASVLKHPLIKASIQSLLQRKGLILGICNGFQALIKSGLLPYGNMTEIKKEDPNLHKNLINRHVSKMIRTKVISSFSPWLRGMSQQIHFIPISHGEGRFVVDEIEIKKLIDNHQIAFQYVDEHGNPSYHPEINPNGSSYAIEGIVSPDGLILGKMGHSERLDSKLYQNMPHINEQSLFTNAVNYIKQRGNTHETTL